MLHTYKNMIPMEMVIGIEIATNNGKWINDIDDDQCKMNIGID